MAVNPETGLTATALSGTDIAVTWNLGDTYAYQNIYVSVEGAAWQLLATVGGYDVYYLHTGLVNGVQYQYQMAGWNGSWSSRATSNTAITTVPEPTGLTATAITEGRIDLAWSNNAQSGSTVHVYVERLVSTWHPLATLGPNDTSYIDNTVVAGTTYSYRLITESVYPIGGTHRLSSYSSSATATPTISAPTNLSGYATSETAVRLTWNDISQVEDGYDIWRATVVGAETHLAYVGANVTSYDDTGLTPSYWYIYKIRAYKGTTYSAFTASVWVRTVATPAAPGTPTVAQVSDTSLSVTWVNNATNALKFYIERSLDNNVWVEIANTPVSTLTYTDTGLTKYTLYYYRVRAWNNDGYSSYSSAGNATTEDFVAAPTGLVCAATTNTNIHLYWVNHADNATGIEIWRNPSGGQGSWTAIHTSDDADVEYNDTVTASTWYQYKIRAKNATTNSTFTTIVSVYSATPPTAPSNFAVQAVSSSQINLTWSTSSGEDGYKIEAGPSASLLTQLTTVLTGTLHYEHIGLTNGTTYYYRIRSYNNAGNSAYSATLHDTTLAGAVQTHVLSLVDVVEVGTHQPIKRKDAIGRNVVYTLGPDVNYPRECFWRSKDLDFAEQLGDEAKDLVKRVNYFKLFYIDLDVDVPTVIQVSVDGGKTWEIQRELIGEGDGLTKEYIFDFCPIQNVSGVLLTFVIACYDASKRFKWTGAEIDLTIFGARTGEAE